MMRSQSASVASRNLVPAFTPAQLMRMSARPVCWRVAANKFSINDRWVTSTVRPAGLDAALLELGHSGFARIVLQVGDDDVGPGRAEPFGQGKAEHAGPADDHGRLAFNGKQIVKILLGGHRGSLSGEVQAKLSRMKASFVVSSSTATSFKIRPNVPVRNTEWRGIVTSCSEPVAFRVKRTWLAVCRETW